MKSNAATDSTPSALLANRNEKKEKSIPVRTKLQHVALYRLARQSYLTTDYSCFEPEYYLPALEQARRALALDPHQPEKRKEHARLRVLKREHEALVTDPASEKSIENLKTRWETDILGKDKSLLQKKIEQDFSVFCLEKPEIERAIWLAVELEPVLQDKANMLLIKSFDAQTKSLFQSFPEDKEIYATSTASLTASAVPAMRKLSTFFTHPVFYRPMTKEEPLTAQDRATLSSPRPE